MTAFPSRRTRSVLVWLAGAGMVAAVLPGSSALAQAVPTPRLPALPSPGLVAPVDGAPVRELVLDWQPVAGATGYEVQVGTDSGWSDTPTWTATTLSSQITPPAWLPHADYVWRVAATRSGGSGRWSVDGAFARSWTAQPALLSPAPDATVTGTVPEFRWSPVPGASAYELQVSDTPAFDEQGRVPGPGVVPGGSAQDQALSQVDTCFTSHTSVTPFEDQAGSPADAPGPCTSTLLGDGGPRWWRVRALDRFASAAAPAVDTTPVSDEGVSHGAPVFDGAPDPDAVSACPGAPVAAAPAATTTVAPDAPAGSPSCTPTHPVEQGAWSDSRLFRVGLAAAAPDTTDRFRTLPLVPTASLTVDNPCALEAGRTVCGDVPTLRWDPVPGAWAYRVYLSRTPSYSNIVSLVDTQGTSWTPVQALRDTTAGAAFHYAVQACTVAGCGPVTSAPPSFRTSAPAPALLGPADRVVLPAGDVVLRWGTLHDALAARGAAAGWSAPAPTQGASAYRLQVTTADDEDFRSPVEDITLDVPVHATADVQYGEGDFLWRVQAVNSSGARLSWSPTRAFSRDTVAPTATVTSGVLAPDAPVVVRFSEPVTGVSAATVQVAPTRAGLPTATRLSVAATSAVLRPEHRGWVVNATYGVRVLAGITDAAGNPVAPATSTLRTPGRVDESSGAFGYAGTWTARRASDAVGGAFRVSAPTTRRPSAASVFVSGRTVVVTGCRTPASGMAEVWVDGVKRLRVDTYRSWTGCNEPIARLTLTPGLHQVQVRGVGLKRSASRGTALLLDAVTASD